MVQAGALMEGICTVEGCDKPLTCYAKYCSMHYQRVYQYGSTDKLEHSLQRKIQPEDRERLIALLRKDCMKHAEIAKRFGVSRERIRQLAKKLGIKSGRKRQETCTINRCEAETQEGFERGFARLIAACPYPLHYVRKQQYKFKFTFRKSSVLCGETVVAVRRGHVLNGAYHFYMGGVLPAIVEFPDGFLVLPVTAPKRSYVTFMLNPTHPHMGAKSVFRGWRDYWNAWENLKVTGQ